MDIKVLASGSKGNCYRISDGHTRLLIEAGLSVKRIREGLSFRLSSVGGVLVSHEHMDHARAVKELLLRGHDVYMSQGTADALELKGHRVRPITAGQQFVVGTFWVLPFEVEHDAAEPLGFVLQSTLTGEKLLYATDTYYTRYRFPGLDYILIECNYIPDILEANVEAGIVPRTLRDRLIESHFSLANVKAFLQANDLSQVREIWLLHLSDGNSDAERFKSEIQKLVGKPVYVAEK